MATTQTCDLCGEAAIDTVEVKSNLTTPVKLDVCEKHLAQWKQMVRFFTGQEVEVKIAESE